jgi:hypothetical protein
LVQLAFTKFGEHYIITYVFGLKTAIAKCDLKYIIEDGMPVDMGEDVLVNIFQILIDFELLINLSRPTWI